MNYPWLEPTTLRGPARPGLQRHLRRGPGALPRHLVRLLRAERLHARRRDLQGRRHLQQPCRELADSTTRRTPAGSRPRATGCSTSAARPAPRRRVRLAVRRRARRSSTGRCRAVGHLPDDARLLPRPPDGTPRLRARWPTTAWRRCAAASATHEHGGWYAKVGADGPVDDRQDGLRARLRGAGRGERRGRRSGRWRRAARRGARRAARALLGRRARHGARAVGRGRSTTLDGYRGVNANMHTVEALLSAADVLDDASLRGPGAADRHARRARPGAGQRLADPRALRRHLDPGASTTTSTSRRTPSGPTAPPSATGSSGPGWPCTCGPDSATTPRRGCSTTPAALFDASVREGWAVDGADGFVYTVDWSGAPVVRERMHWVAAEATATAAALHAATGEPSYDDVVRHLVAARRRPLPRPRARLVAPRARRRTNEPSSVTWQGKPDIYHAFQATLIPRLPLVPDPRGRPPRRPAALALAPTTDAAPTGHLQSQPL